MVIKLSQIDGISLRFRLGLFDGAEYLAFLFFRERGYFGAAERVLFPESERLARKPVHFNGIDEILFNFKGESEVRSSL